VRERDEPELRGLKQRRDALVVCLPPSDVPLQETEVDFARDPLACVLDRAVEHRRARGMTPANAGDQLEGPDGAPAAGCADPDRLRDARIRLRDALNLGGVPV